ncbi:hypothetical protein N177_1634 [Lutibaculum baratangense AMV1]|uniref:Uncharacterized protein n=1 Tax=Lutibaculum baratangense AMV1 TaxID=631454 RepID=V4R0K6_9HYPH|nr:hypothetical protein N177_1634 [Lutibaculum baratangense AMV1]
MAYLRDTIDVLRDIVAFLVVASMAAIFFGGLAYVSHVAA